MSCYEWERGEFKLPSAEWAGFKQKIRDAINASNKVDYEFALKVHAALGSALKGLKKPDLWDVAYREADNLNPKTYQTSYQPKYSADTIFRVVSSIVDRNWDAGTGKNTMRVKKPQKKDFPQHGNNVTEFSANDCSLTFNNAAKTAYWSVHQNNHAVEHARESSLGRALFSALGKVAWTRGTGGMIIGNDEYNRDSDYEGGGANYAKESFGPKEGTAKATLPPINPYARYRF